MRYTNLLTHSLLVNGKSRFSDPRERKPLNQTTSNFTWLIMSEIAPHVQNLESLPLRGTGLHMHKIVNTPCVFLHTFLASCSPAQMAPFDRLSWLIHQKTCFLITCILCYIRTTRRLIFFPIFCKKCKICIAGTSKEIDRPYIRFFACTIGFSAMTDQMAWPPSLSRDCK